MYRYLFFALLMLAACSGNKKSQPTPRPRPQTKPSTTTKPSDTNTTAPLPVNTAEGNIAWTESELLMPVLEEAQRLHKPVFVAFHASWCAPCKVMEEENFTRPQVYSYLNQRFINFRTDYDSPAGRRIAEIFEVSKLPTVLFVSEKGVALERYTGIISAAEIERLGNLAILKNK